MGLWIINTKVMFPILGDTCLERNFNSMSASDGTVHPPDHCMLESVVLQISYDAFDTFSNALLGSLGYSRHI